MLFENRLEYHTNSYLYLVIVKAVSKMNKDYAFLNVFECLEQKPYWRLKHFSNLRTLE